MKSLLNDAGYDGIWLCEYYGDHFHPLNGTVYEEVKSALNEICNK